MFSALRYSLHIVCVCTTYSRYPSIAYAGSKTNTVARLYCIYIYVNIECNSTASARFFCYNYVTTVARLLAHCAHCLLALCVGQYELVDLLLCHRLGNVIK